MLLREQDDFQDEEEFSLMKQFTEWDNDLDAHWTEWRREAKEDFDYFAGRSWTEAERRELIERKRIPIEFNRANPLIKAVSGAEIQARTRVEYAPRTQGDVVINEVLTQAGEHFRDKNDAASEETEAFQNRNICGIGVVETRIDDSLEGRPDIYINHCDSLEFAIDPSARRVNAVDAEYIRRRRYFSRRNAEKRFGKEAFSTDDEQDETSERVNRGPGHRYEDDGDMETSEQRVLIREYQWFDKEYYEEAELPDGQKLTATTEKEMEMYQAQIPMFPLTWERRSKRVYKRAYVTGMKILEVDTLPIPWFTYCFITGDYDRNKGTWFGLMRLMKHPQKWANKLFSTIIHQVATGASGGVMAEEGAIKDMAAFRKSYARNDEITEVADGALVEGQIQSKEYAPYPQGLEQMMEIAVTAIRDTAGISPEFLGQADRAQPGVLEHSRIQRAYGMLGTFFDAIGRYRKVQGRVLLKLMKMLPPGTLVRIAKDNDPNMQQQYVQLEDIIRGTDVDEYDVDVEEAPDGPNMKERMASTLMQVIQLFTPEMLTPPVLIEVLRYMPLNSEFIAKLEQIYAQQAQDPEVIEQQKQAKEAQAVDTTKTLTDAIKQAAETKKIITETAQIMENPDPKPQVTV